jgi:hypothetical protein
MRRTAKHLVVNVGGVMARVASTSKFDGISHADAILTSVHYRVAGCGAVSSPESQPRISGDIFPLSA